MQHGVCLLPFRTQCGIEPIQVRRRERRPFARQDGLGTEVMETPRPPGFEGRDGSRTHPRDLEHCGLFPGRQDALEAAPLRVLAAQLLQHCTATTLRGLVLQPCVPAPISRRGERVRGALLVAEKLMKACCRAQDVLTA